MDWVEERKIRSRYNHFGKSSNPETQPALQTVHMIALQTYLKRFVLIANDNCNSMDVITKSTVQKAAQPINWPDIWSIQEFYMACDLIN